jgi:uncharacterized protein (TIRG00374 family)
MVYHIRQDILKQRKERAHSSPCLKAGVSCAYMMNKRLHPGQDDGGRQHSGPLLAETHLHQEGVIGDLPLRAPAMEERPIGAAELSLSKRLLNWRTLLPLLIVIAALALLFKQEQIDPQATWRAIRTANLLSFLAAFAIYYLSFPLRAWRWRLLLRNVGLGQGKEQPAPRFWKLVEIIYISWFVNALVPAKLGDLYRAYLLRQESGYAASRTFGTVLAERLLDLTVLLLLCIPAVMISLHERMPWEVRFGLTVTLILVLVGIVGLCLLRLLRARLRRIIPRRLRVYYEHLQEGMLGSFRQLPTLTGLTLGVWSCEALRFFFVVVALSLFSGSLLHMLAAALFIALVEALLTAIPFTGGGVGLVEGGMIALIALFRPDATSLALAAIVLDRAISFLSILVIGFPVFLLAVSRQAAKRSADA